MVMPTEEQIRQIEERCEALKPLSDMRLVMWVLAELLMESDVPIGSKIPLYTELTRRIGMK